MLKPRRTPAAVDASFDAAGRLNLTVGARPPAVDESARSFAIESAGPITGPGGVTPSTAGVLTIALLAGLAILGGLLGVRRRLDPTLRAESIVFDRAGLGAADRRTLRRAARRLEPPVPAVSLLLAEALIDQAAEATPPSSPDAARLNTIARRQFGERPSGESPVARASEAIRPRRPAGTPEDAHRTRAASRLAIALEMAALRRSAIDGGSPGPG
jgi:hypothetical protein